MSYSFPDSDEESSEPVKKKKKRAKAQKVVEMNGFHEMGEDENNLSGRAPMKKSKKKLKNTIKEHQETSPKKARKEKKRKAMAKEEVVPAVSVVDAQSGDDRVEIVGVAKSTERMDTEDVQSSSPKKEKGITENTEELLFPEVFVDSCDAKAVLQLSKKGKKRKKFIESGNAADTESVVLENGGIEPEVHEEATGMTKLTKKKKNRKKLSTEEALEVSVNTAEKAVKPKKSKKKKEKSEHLDMNKDMDGDFEIFVPNKKYNGPLKAGFQKAMEASLGDTSGEKLGKSFAKFDCGAKVPAAFVRRAMSKSKVIKAEPQKCKLVRELFLLNKSDHSSNTTNVRTSLIDNLHTSTTPLYRSFYLGLKRSPMQ